MPATRKLRRPAFAALLAVAVAAAAAWLSPTAIAQHTKVSLESVGPDGGNGGQSANLVGAESAGKRAIVTTAEPLVASDTDSSLDLYERTGGGTALLSTGPQAGNGAFPASFGVTVEAGRTVFFQTEEKLLAGDTDDTLDIYRREGTSLVRRSFGPDGGNGPHDAYLAGVTEDGSRVFFTTREALLSSDTDASLDVYERIGGATRLISPGTAARDVSDTIGTSADGAAVFFSTTESLLGSDTDNVRDVYGAFDTP
jgi:hypothetical protein